MSDHVLMNILNEMRKSNKIQGLQRILSLFHNKFNKFNNTRARMLVSIYHMTQKIFEIAVLALKSLDMPYSRNILINVTA